MMMDLNEIGRFLGETQYKVEMTELASRYDGVNLIELGTIHEPGPDVHGQILGFCTGDLKDMVEKYLADGTYGTSRPCCAASSPRPAVEEIQEDIVPAAS